MKNSMIFLARLLDCYNSSTKFYNRMMTRILILLIFSFIFQISNAQSWFELNYTTADRNSCVGALETEGNFIFIILNQANNPDYSHPVLLWTDSNGNILQQLVFDKKDACFLYKIFYNEIVGNYSVFGVFASYPDLIYDSLIIIRVSDSLELLEYTTIGLPFEDYNGISDVYLNSDGQYIVTGYNWLNRYGFIYVLDDELNLINNKVYDFSSQISSITEYSDQNSSGYLIVIMGRPPGFSSSGEYLIKSDQFLNDLYYYSLSQLFETELFGGGNTTITKLADSAFIVIGKHSNLQMPPNNRKNVAALKIDHFCNLQNIKLFGKQNDTVDYPAINPGATISGFNDVYVPGTSNFNISQHPYSSTPSWFMLNKVDSELNLQWQKFYGGDAYYFLYSIIATSDGGCVMMGTRYHPDNPTVIDAYILKVGPDGLVSIPEVEGGLQVREVILYPNPGTSQLYIQTGHDDLELHFYTANGSLHFKDRINQFSHMVNTASWPDGTYLYQIFKGIEIMDSGKWIKSE